MTVVDTSWMLDAAPPEWLRIPWLGADVDLDKWREDAALIFRLLEDVDRQVVEPGTAPRAGLDIDDAIATLLAFSSGLPDGHDLVAGLSVPGRWPLPVIVSVTASGADEDLLSAAGARGGHAIEAPVVEYLPEELGDGIRVTRFDLDDDGTVWASVCCARRAAGLDTVLTWRTSELDLVPLFSPLLESLLAAVRTGGGR